MHGSILPVTIPSPGNPWDKSSPLGPGVGNCLKQSCPGGRGWGTSKIARFSCEVRHFLGWHNGIRQRGEECLFPGEISRNCSRLVREEYSLKIKICIQRNVYYKLLNKRAFDAYSNGWCSSQTKKYFFSVFIYTVRWLNRLCIKMDARLYIKQSSQSSVLMKQARENSFQMLPSICSTDLFCVCVIYI